MRGRNIVARPDERILSGMHQGAVGNASGLPRDERARLPAAFGYYAYAFSGDVCGETDTDGAALKRGIHWNIFFMSIIFPDHLVGHVSSPHRTKCPLHAENMHGHFVLML